MAGQEINQPKDVLDAAIRSPMGMGIAGLLMGKAMFGGAGREEAPMSTMQAMINTALTAENTQKIYSS
jgi:hypothetical protein